jgi:hypothetical protein
MLEGIRSCLHSGLAQHAVPGYLACLKVCFYHVNYNGMLHICVAICEDTEEKMGVLINISIRCMCKA